MIQCIDDGRVLIVIHRHSMLGWFDGGVANQQCDWMVGWQCSSGMGESPGGEGE